MKLWALVQNSGLEFTPVEVTPVTNGNIDKITYWHDMKDASGRLFHVSSDMVFTHRPVKVEISDDFGTTTIWE